MFMSKKLTLALVINATFISTTFASEQSDAKGFVEDAQGSVLFRTGFLNRDKKDGLSNDTSSTAQTAIFTLNSGFTQGPIGFAVGVVGDTSFKLGDNKNTGNQMIPRDDQGQPYDHWARGGGQVKARISNTTLTYGTQISELPVLASNTARLVPEYYTGLLLHSHEIKNLGLIAAKFTKNQWSNDISSDGQNLDRAIVLGATYKFNDHLNSVIIKIPVTK